MAAISLTQKLEEEKKPKQQTKHLLGILKGKNILCVQHNQNL